MWEAVPLRDYIWMFKFIWHRPSVLIHYDWPQSQKAPLSVAHSFDRGVSWDGSLFSHQLVPETVVAMQLPAAQLDCETNWHAGHAYRIQPIQERAWRPPSTINNRASGCVMFVDNYKET